ncbi:hypothetical protein CO115_00350 [Candidatus Falkowbacteria bacterium CG_4_9_14_3_um_filter_36_9]|uniref:Thioredoxin domain-containing protein n=1 Tax=Candidatus Falkowbacteria bacterium CG02_land_8_20_14_3_00_36_14 TaxID=1974560 RepID=A0A2M7DLM2_9BACT|nr:MAG: hypothetical protein COS18_04320 [Candidatus Falkowbacteria bacterium CG02_land_8_20_14_3_00_36_14]PIX11570.1 MAG: hypothetical protein COZ73_02270 [Candidatus Falkowbacteria bacterium CG_4_8_14_3_um_filter_36_11]PJA10114.1 MAG: hypothetical protein COX67_05460 [Candidatus Falkowbacteria bacterium CG_4_10_14_0_2_um_filter_36_22]PJB20796.1 MAG: hypothetical protein CO115_00350 [Candidatus Falkowbacteria bacterium CG_4_9_14_3_um_filter_36_9]
MEQIKNKPWHKNWLGRILIIIGVFILIILTAFIFLIIDIIRHPQNKKISNNITANEPNQKIAEGGDNYWFGSANPEITIVEFSDFACPYCEQSYSKIRQISLKYKNEVKLIYRDFPLRQAYSIDLAMAGRCAGEQGLFWLMHDKLFQNQGVNTADELIKLANQIGADINKFTGCLNGKKYAFAIQKDIADAEKLEVSGTPTWFVNGNKIEGDLPLDLWEEIINMR